MPDTSFEAAARTLSTAFEAGTDFCEPFLAAFPINFAAISTLGEPFGSETVCASDPRAARLDELQIDFGVGPCWDALALRAPVVDSDLLKSVDSGWPHLRQAFRDNGVRAVYAFPLAVGTLSVGSVDLYGTVPAPMTSADIARAGALATIVATQVLQRALARLPQTEGDTGEAGEYSRRDVHQATGMVVAQLGVPASVALLNIRGHAFALGVPVREVAQQVIARVIRFDTPTT